MGNSIKGLVGSASIFFMLGWMGCHHTPENQNTPLEEVAGSAEVLNYMKTFDGRGALTDSTPLTPPQEALPAFRYPDDLALDLVLSEPTITQPVFMTIDHRGRLWVVQYNQYPYPKGVKVMGMDQHIRAQFDKVPQPPPMGAKGADKVSFFEDTDGDGIMDKSTDAITGLNIATSVALGRGKIWVLAPPYLLAYPDARQDGLPDGEPVVHLEGFGLEDTHAVANNLRWGPDGWLYGAQGSTCTAKVSSSASKNVRFNGQAIWRYHPDTHVFEVFAEGGGNTFDVEFDAQGRLYSGDNGQSRGRYYKQGAYHVRNLGKHGAYTNPYSLGFLQDMEHEGEKARFTHAFIKYEEESLPEKYHGQMLAINPLQRYVLQSSFAPHGSTFSVKDKGRILETDDHWFRPVDMATGPDGAVYLVDWYDSRLTHVDPRDTWSKNTGRIYRLRNKKAPVSHPALDISAYTDQQLIEALSNRNKWFRQQALLELGNRKNKNLLPPLLHLMKTGAEQTALEVLWAIHLTGGFDEGTAITALHHAGPFVRMWAVRLLGDVNAVSPVLAQELSTLALREPHPEVRSQLAATAKRLPGEVALPIVKNLLLNHDDAQDPDIPLQLWWALESKAITHRSEILALWEDDRLWEVETARLFILGRLMQRWVLEGGERDYQACTQLLALAPSDRMAKPLIDGLQEGLRGRDVTPLPHSLVKALQRFQSGFGNASLALALRQGQPQAVEKALKAMGDPQTEIGERLSYIRIFGEIHEPKSVPLLLKLMESNPSWAVKQAALEALPRYDDAEIGMRTTKAYPDKLRSDPLVREAALALLASRKAWAIQLLEAIDRKKQPGEKFIAHTIDKADVPLPIARQLLLFNDSHITETVQRLWPGVLPVSPSGKNAEMARVSTSLKSGKGNAVNGKLIFTSLCGRCHRLFGEGAALAPDLTGYDRGNIGDLMGNIIDPSAYIREGYEAYAITTRDQRSFLGMLKGSQGTSRTFQGFNGQVIELSNSDIVAMEAQKTSLMPERLLEGLPDQQLRDLAAYMQSMPSDKTVPGSQ